MKFLAFFSVSGGWGNEGVGGRGFGGWKASKLSLGKAGSELETRKGAFLREQLFRSAMRLCE
jgi:hypothetical protein